MSKIQVIMICILLCTSFVAISGCISSDANDNENIGIIVSIPPYGEWVEKIGGEKVDLLILVPEGASPHTYEPTPSQMVKVSEADIWIKNGVGLEFWANKIVSQNEDITIIDVSELIELIERDGIYDAHVWLSPETAKVSIQAICSTLCTLDPMNTSYYQTNYTNYLKEIESVDEEIIDKLKFVESKTILVMHPAWTYFANHYGLEQVALEESGNEPGPERLTYIIDYAKENNISVIFVEPQFSAQEAEIVAREIDGKVISINPLSESYLDNLKLTTQLLLEGLQ